MGLVDATLKRSDNWFMRTSCETVNVPRYRLRLKHHPMQWHSSSPGLIAGVTSRASPRKARRNWGSPLSFNRKIYGSTKHCWNP